MSGFWLDDEEEDNRPWTLARIYADLGTRTDVCKALDVGAPRMNMWLHRRERIKCPYPIRRFGHIDVYSITEWRAWFDKWQKKNARKTPDNKWVETKPHDAGSPFFNFDDIEMPK